MSKSIQVEVSRNSSSFVTITFIEKNAYVSMPPKDNEYLRHYRYVVYNAEGHAIFGIEEV